MQSSRALALAAFASLAVLPFGCNDVDRPFPDSGVDALADASGDAATDAARDAVDGGEQGDVDAARPDAPDAGPADTGSPVSAECEDECPEGLCCARGANVCAPPGVAWTQLPALEATPLVGHVAALDREGRRMLVHGGYTGITGSGDTFELDLSPGADPSWSRIEVEGRAPRMSYHAGVFDPVSDPPRLVVFDGGPVHALELPRGGQARWVVSTPEESAPPHRGYSAAVFDPFNRRMVMYGGGEENQPRDDVWELDLSGPTLHWRELQPTGEPRGRSTYHSAIYDEANRRMVIVGGRGTSMFDFVDVWALDLRDPGAPEWIRLPVLPRPILSHHGAAYDEARQRMLVFAGINTQPRADVWALPLTASGEASWQRLPLDADPRPPARYRPTTVYDPAGVGLVAFAGWTDQRPLRDTWVLSLAECD